MIVTSGSDWLAPGGVNRRSWSISLDDNDGMALLGEDEWDLLSWNKKRAYLQMRADLEVLVYMHKEGALTTDFVKDRAAKIKAEYEATK